MCSINHDLKAVFIHIPKNGGLFIQNMLDTYYDFKTIYFTHENHKDFIDDSNIDNIEIKKQQKILRDNIFGKRMKLTVQEESDNLCNNKNNDHDSDSDSDNGANDYYQNGFIRIKKKGMLRYNMSSEKHKELSKMTNDKWKDYYKFTIVRNPYDKLVSAYHFINKSFGLNKEQLENNTFEKFIKNINNCNNFVYTHAFITQTDHLLDLNDELKIDGIGRFENLNEDFCKLLLDLNIPLIKHEKSLKKNVKINKSSKKINYAVYYTNELIEFVNNHFHDDFENFGFKKCKNIEELIEDSVHYFIPEDEFHIKNNKLILKLKDDNKLSINNDDDDENNMNNDNNNEGDKSIQFNVNGKINISENELKRKIESELKKKNMSDLMNKLKNVDHFKNIMKTLKNLESVPL